MVASLADLDLKLGLLTGAELIALATVAATNEPRVLVEKLIDLAYKAFDRTSIGRGTTPR
jgi:hypothetical protein